MRIIIIFILIAILMNCATLSARKTQELLEMNTEQLFDLSLEELLDIEITSAGKMAEKISEIPASVYIVLREDIEKYGYRTLPEIMRNIPGFYSIYDYRDNVIGVRGLLNDKNMIIMVNGVALTNSEVTDIPIPIEAIDRIEVVRGPMSVIYGSGAFLGSINIVTNDIPYGAPLSMFSGSYGSLNMRNVFVRTSNEISELQYTLNASLFATDGLKHPYKKMLSEEQLSILEAYQPDVHMHTDGDLDAESKYLNFSAEYKGFYTDFQLNDSIKGMFDDFSFNKGSTKRMKITTAQIGYRDCLYEQLQFDGKLTYAHFHGYEIYDTYAPSLFEYGIIGNGQGKEKNFEIELDMIWKPTPELNMISGINYQTHVNILYKGKFPIPLEFGGNYLDAMYKPSHRDTRSWFIQTNYKPIDSLKFIAGARFEQYLRYDADAVMVSHESTTIIKEYMNTNQNVYFIPRIAAIFSKNNHHIFKIMYGEANKPFSDLEIALLDLQRGTIIEHLPEEIETLEFNYLITQQKTSISISLYKNNIENIGVIRFKEKDEGDFIPIRDNSGRMVTYGGEVIVTRQWLSNLSMELSTSYQETLERAHKERKQPFSPHLIFKAKTDYQWNNLTLTLSGLYVGDMRPQKPPPDIPGGNRFQLNTYDHKLIDFNIRYDFKHTGWFMACKISNVLDHEIRYPATDNAQFVYGLLDEGRSFMATAGLKF
ncbi:MAG: TonB-dependent receptor [Desulfobacterales bacterium]|nr:TonB-dependent receptor [Desulfobacterales bacterium]